MRRALDRNSFFEITKTRLRNTTACSVVVLILFLNVLADGKAQSYEKGELVAVVLQQSPYGPLGNPPFPSYLVFIRVGDVVYGGSCRREQFTNEWKVKDDVEFRIVKNFLFLKRPNGKELRLAYGGTLPAKSFESK